MDPEGEPPVKRNRSWDAGYTWQELRNAALISVALSIVCTAVFYWLGWGSAWSPLIIFGSLSVISGVRAWLLYRHTKRMNAADKSRLTDKGIDR